MTEATDLRERLDAMETRLAYQDHTIEELNRTVTDQWKEIDGLNRQIANLTDRVKEAEARAAAGSAPEPPPPHY